MSIKDQIFKIAQGESQAISGLVDIALGGLSLPLLPISTSHLEEIRGILQKEGYELHISQDSVEPLSRIFILMKNNKEVARRASIVVPNYREKNNGM